MPENELNGITLFKVLISNSGYQIIEKDNIEIVGYDKLNNRFNIKNGPMC